MSINKIRQSFETKGCQAALIVCGVLLMAALVLPSTCSGFMGNQQQPGEAATDMVIAKVGSREVKLSQVASIYEAQEKQFANFGQALTEPDMKFTIFSAALKQTIDTSLLMELASRKGVSLDDVTILTAYEKQLDDGIAQAKAQLIAEKKVPASASEADFDKALSTQLGGQTVKEYGTAQLEMIKKGLADPATKDSVIGQIVPSLISEAYQAQATITDEELKKSYDSFVLDAIAFNDLKQSLADREKKADEAYAQLEAGKDFATVRKEFAPSAPTAPVTLPRTQIEAAAELGPLLELKPGEFAEPIMREGSPVIYKLAKINSAVPKDFETTKAMLVANRRQQVATQQLTKEFEELKAKNTIVWENPTMETFYKIASVSTVSSLVEQREQYLQLADALAVPEADPTKAINPEWVALGRYFAYNQAYSLSKPEDQKEMRETLAEIGENALEFSESSTLRLKLVQLYAELDNGQAVADTLRMAAENNTGYDAPNQQTYAEVARLLKKYTDEKKVTADQAKRVQDALDTWLKEKVAYEKEQADFKKEQEAATKELDEADRKAAEEEAKKSGQAPKPKTGG